MNEDEAHRLFQELRAILNDEGLQWVVEQVDAQLRLEREEPVVVAELNLLDLPRGRAQRSQLPSTRTVPYDAWEQLQLLVNATRRACEVIRMGSEFVSATGAKIADLEFVSDDEEPETWVLDPKELSASTRSADSVMRLLDELASELSSEILHGD